jgi:hypothetical protein
MIKLVNYRYNNCQKLPFSLANGKSEDGTCRIWDVKTGRELHCLQGHRVPNAVVAFSPDGRYCVTGLPGGLVKLWKMPTLQPHTDERRSNPSASQVVSSMPAIPALKGKLRAIVQALNQWSDHVDLQNMGLVDDDITAFAACPEIGVIETLNLDDNNFSSVGLAALAASPYLKKLKAIRLHRNTISDGSAIALANASFLTNFSELNLAVQQLGDDGVIVLVASPYIANLTNLDLCGNKISDRGAAALVASPYLSKLTKLDLSWNRNISNEQMDQLMHKFGKALIYKS